MLSLLAWLAFVLLSVVALWCIVGYVGLLIWQRYGPSAQLIDGRSNLTR
jgi:hypothetical protein